MHGGQSARAEASVASIQEPSRYSQQAPSPSSTYVSIILKISYFSQNVLNCSVDILFYMYIIYGGVTFLIQHWAQISAQSIVITAYARLTVY